MEEIFIKAFSGIDRNDYEMLTQKNCLSKKSFSKGEYILLAGDSVHQLGLVCSGNVQIENDDLWGNKSILSRVGVGQVFAETYALCREPLMVNVVATEDTVILFVDIGIMLDGSNQKEVWHPKIMKNLLIMSAKKSIVLSNRIFCTTAKTIRGRLSTYFSAQIAKNTSYEFDIPFDRQQLADYLNLDRSALSKELGKMKREGLIEYNKNHFKIVGNTFENF